MDCCINFSTIIQSLKNFIDILMILKSNIFLNNQVWDYYKQQNIINIIKLFSYPILIKTMNMILYCIIYLLYNIVYIPMHNYNIDDNQINVLLSDD